jgi:hypothetical protein
MTLLVESGTGVAGANTYITLEDFQTHCEDRGRSYSSYTEEQQEAALVRMGDYLNSLSWKGVRTKLTQSMSWPRYGTEVGGSEWNRLEFPATQWVGVLDQDGWYLATDAVPPQVVDAQCEGAWLILTGSELEPSLDRGGQVIREKYDVIEFEYAKGAPPGVMPTTVMNRLRGLLKDNVTMQIRRA